MLARTGEGQEGPGVNSKRVRLGSGVSGLTVGDGVWEVNLGEGWEK